MAYLFIDTEFTDFKNTELISVALVSEDGEHQFYRENTSHEPNFRSEFVNKVVMPLLEGGEYAKTYPWVAEDLIDWFDSLPYSEVTIVCDYIGDWALFEKLLNVARPRKPKIKIQPMMLDYAFNEMLTFRGFKDTPELRSAAMEKMAFSQSEYYKQDDRIHHALVDAKSNRHGWLVAYNYAQNA